MPKYTNSEKTVQFKFERMARPESIDELKNILSRAYKENRRIKVHGGSHTFSHIKKTADTLLDLSGIEELRSVIEVDRAKRTAVLGGGCVLADAVDELYKVGLQFPMLGGWFTQTIGGAIATSTHGTSFHHGTISDQVLEIEAILADGSIVHYKENDSEIKAWRTHLGQLGIVTKVKLQLEDLSFLQCSTEDFLNGDEGFTAMNREILAWNRVKTPYLNLLWLPYFGENGRALLRRLNQADVNRPNEKAVENEEKAEQKSRNLAAKIAEDRITNLLGRRFLNKPLKSKDFWSNAVAGSFLKDNGVRDRSFRLFCYSQYREPNKNQWLRQVLNVETAIDVKHFMDVYRDLSDLLRRHLAKGEVLNYPRFHFRFTPGSEKTLLGTNYGRNSFYFGSYVSAVAMHKKQIPLSIEIEKLLSRYGGRPHWGKYRYLRDDDSFYDTYGENLQKFKDYRREFDPRGIFSDGWKMFAGLDRLEKPGIIKKPFSSLNPKNYDAVRFLGGRSGDLI